MQSAQKATGRLTISATAAATGLSELASSGPPLGRPKCASRMTLPPFSAISSIVGADAFDAGRVGHAAIFGRDVEVDPQEDALAGYVGIIERAERIAHVRLPAKVRSIECHYALRCRASRSGRSGTDDQSSFDIATAVSAMRLEKPHSLSYQESTRTNLPSITLVWSRWKTDERLS